MTVSSLADFMDRCPTRNDLYQALKPCPRKIHFNIIKSGSDVGLVENLELMLSLARNSIEQHQQPISIIQISGTTLNFPDIGSSTSSTRKIAILFTLLRTVQATINTNQIRTIRDVYYSNVELYGNQRRAENWLSIITKNLCLTSRDSLNIVPAQKGLCYSPLKIRVLTNGKESFIPARTSSIIPYMSQNSIVQVLSGGDKKLQLIVLEKEAVYNRVVDIKHIDSLQDTIVITGKGYPDFLTRLFLNRLQDVDSIIDWHIFTDADPYGIDIALKYMQNDSNENYKCSKLRYSGILLSQLLKRRDVQFLKLGHRDSSLAIRLLNRLATIDQPTSNTRLLVTELQRQIFLQKKAEMNAISREHYLSR